MSQFLDAAVAATRGEFRITSAEALARSKRSGVVDVPEAERIALLPARGRTLAWLIVAGMILIGGLAFALVGGRRARFGRWSASARAWWRC